MGASHIGLQDRSPFNRRVAEAVLGDAPLTLPPAGGT